MPALTNGGNLVKLQMAAAIFSEWKNWRAAAQIEQSLGNASPYWYMVDQAVDLDPWGPLLVPIFPPPTAHYLGVELLGMPVLTEDQLNGEVLLKFPVGTVSQGIIIPHPPDNWFDRDYLGWFIYPDKIGVLPPSNDKVLAKGIFDTPQTLHKDDMVNFRLTLSVKNRLWP